MDGSLMDRLARAVETVRARSPLAPEVALILGSGLGGLADQVEGPVELPFEEIPGFARSTVAGHHGSLVLGRLEGRAVAVLRGRIHYYEGHSMADLVFPLRVMHGLGARTLVVTNAAGGISTRLGVGDLMLLEDHLNLMGDHPLRGPNEDRLGPRFPSMSRAYDRGLRELARRVAVEEGFSLQEGVYCALSGPSYETPAEIRMLGRLGADAVGMSTVPEALAAVHMGMRILGISCITNVLHQGPSEDTHEEVLQAAAAARPRFVALVRGILRGLPS